MLQSNLAEFWGDEYYAN